MSLITRNHAKVTLEGARAVLAAAERHATEIKVPMNIAIVDDGARLLAFARMDGAKPASVAVSLVKAQAAAMRRAPTGPAMSGDQVNVALAIGLASVAPDHQTPIRGGLPLVVDGEVVGAIGVSAGTEDQDVEVARAGVAFFEKAQF
ncbi:MAG TPA: heme-binding protein [Candidatus Acidoferrales bacterium]|nr:heme-binding protein [Candidatus Acidoferrales bacterium]